MTKEQEAGQMKQDFGAFVNNLNTIAKTDMTPEVEMMISKLFKERTELTPSKTYASIVTKSKNRAVRFIDAYEYAFSSVKHRYLIEKINSGKVSREKANSDKYEAKVHKKMVKRVAVVWDAFEPIKKYDKQRLIVRMK